MFKTIPNVKPAKAAPKPIVFTSLTQFSVSADDAGQGVVGIRTIGFKDEDGTFTPLSDEMMAQIGKALQEEAAKTPGRRVDYKFEGYMPPAASRSNNRQNNYQFHNGLVGAAVACGLKANVYGQQQTQGANQAAGGHDPVEL